MLRENVERRRVAWEQELVAGMRRDEPEAFMEFFRAFRPLLMAEARRLHVQPALCPEIVDECLDDVAMRLRRYTTPIPRSLAPYLVRALRLHRLAQRRGEGRRVDKRAEAAAPSSDLASVLEATVSEAAMRDSAGPDHERTPASAALERLASMVEEGLSDEEEMILSWVSRWVPQSHIAEWLGISHGAARNRVMRLRARLKDAAIRHVASFTGRERTELMDFFRRTFPASRYRQIADSLEEPAPLPAPPPRARTGTDRGPTDA